MQLAICKSYFNNVGLELITQCVSILAVLLALNIDSRQYLVHFVHSYVYHFQD